MHSLQSNSWQTKHTYSKMACLWSYPRQEQLHSMYGSTTISLAKMHVMLRICQKYFIEKVEQDWLMLCTLKLQKIAGLDQLQLYLQNILTEHLQNMHGSLCSIKFTWQQNNSRRGLREITKSLKSETLWSLLCMLVLVATEINKIHGIHPWKYGMAYFKTHVELMPKRCTELKIQKWQISKFWWEPENNSN